MNQGTLISTNTPPTAWRNGDLSGAGTQIYVPNSLGLASSTPIAGDVIAPSLINPVSAKILNLFFPARQTRLPI